MLKYLQAFSAGILVASAAAFLIIDRFIAWLYPKEMEDCFDDCEEIIEEGPPLNVTLRRPNRFMDFWFPKPRGAY